MAKKFADSARALLDILSGHDPDEQTRLLQGAAVMLGLDASVATNSGVDHIRETPPDTSGKAGIHAGSAASPQTDPALYFANKDPKTKQEQLAVAVRFREAVLGSSDHNKESIAQFFSDAKQNFDSSNFGRDLDNAKNKGLFLKQPAIELTYGGKQFVDLLPDRDSATQHLKPPKKRTTKKAAKKKTRKDSK